MRFKFTEESLLRSKVLQPTWYVCSIKSVQDKVSKSSGADMIDILFVVTNNPNNPKCADNTPSAGVPLKEFHISEAGIGFAQGFMEALLKRKLKAEEEFDTEVLRNAVGKELKVKVKNDEYQGRIGNTAEAFASL